jgi:hypothetical protein
MNVQERNEIRELTADELNEVSGGAIDPFTAGALVAFGISVFGVAVACDILYKPNLWDQVEAYANSQRG